MTPTNDLIISVFALLVCAVIGVLGFRRHFAPHDKLKPRMVPWMIISLGCIATSFMIIVHIVNIFGFETGRR